MLLAALCNHTAHCISIVWCISKPICSSCTNKPFKIFWDLKFYLISIYILFAEFLSVLIYKITLRLLYSCAMFPICHCNNCIYLFVCKKIIIVFFHWIHLSNVLCNFRNHNTFQFWCLCISIEIICFLIFFSCYIFYANMNFISVGLWQVIHWQRIFFFCGYADILCIIV